MASLPNAVDAVMERLQESSQTGHVSKSFSSAAAFHPKTCFLNPKIFPLPAGKSTPTFRPAYCALLNFDAALYPLPTTMSAEDRSNRLDLAEEGRIVKYTGPGRNDSDAAAVRSNTPLPPQVGLYFFEVSVVNKGRDGYISVGFAIKSASLSRLCGWEPGTIGYHADDGNLYRGAGSGTAFGPAYSTGDVIGCGVSFQEKYFFFTKNGVLVGEVRNLKDKFHLPFFPCVGCRTQGEVLSCNFGAKPFVFDIESYIQRRFNTTFARKESSAHECQVQERLVLSYLVHAGFQRTAKAFLGALSDGGGVEAHQISAAFEAAQTRRKVFEAVKAGDVAELAQLINANYPAFLMEHPAVAFRLECLSFVQMIRDGFVNDEKLLRELLDCGNRLATSFSCEVLTKFGGLLNDVLALVAYQTPSESPVAYLLDRHFRLESAAFVDEALLKFEGKDTVSPLHRLLQQTQTVMDELQYLEDPEIALIKV
jgi:hypothetical protein